ncbi:MAG: thioredoxin-dependent thiol peroxidase [Chloroflexi bacterium]|nr:thioredoxin-dependent thiol peroxidase [Chloroflexota bacterium]
MPNIGDMAPDFELLNQDGEPTKLSDFRGKTVILFAYPKADTPGCTTQACGLRDAFPRFQDKNATVIGISPDEPAALKKWIAKQNLPYTLVSDPDHAVLEAWNAWGERSMYGKTYMGVIRSHWVIGPDGKLVDVQLGVKPEASVESAIKVVVGE